MKERLRFTGIDNTKDLVLNDCPDFDFTELIIETNKYRDCSVKMSIEQMIQLNHSIERILWEKCYLNNKEKNRELEEKLNSFENKHKFDKIK